MSPRVASAGNDEYAVSAEVGRDLFAAESFARSPVSPRAAAAGKGDDFKLHPAFISRPQYPVQGQNHNFMAYTHDGKDWLGIATTMADGWTLITQMERSEALEPLAELNQRAAITLLLSIVFVGLLSFLLGRTLSAPIINLTQITDNISRGDFDEDALDKIGTHDEIGVLANSVRRLAVSIKIAMEMLSGKQPK